MWNSGVGSSSLLMGTQLISTDGNLYIGTSASEILHYVSLPGDSNSPETTLILASRTQPTTVASLNLSKGVQQVLILPSSSKACILCNGTLTFHTLPELSPAPNTLTVSNVLWIGGIDLDVVENPNEDDPADFFLMSLRTKIRLVRVGERVTSPKSLDYPGCLTGARRGRYACVADTRSYALIDLENSQKIPLFPISSLDDTAISFSDRQRRSSLGGFQKSQNISSPSGPQSHSRNTSLGNFMGNLARQADQRRPSAGRIGYETPELRSGAVSPARSSSLLGTPNRQASSPNRPQSSAQVSDASPERAPAKTVELKEQLQPQILSPLSTEFLLLTGTSASEAGVGMFVNLDGDVVRGTIEFSNFPINIVFDGNDNLDSSTHGSLPSNSAGYLLALMERSYPDGIRVGLEIHKWDDQNAAKHWLEIGAGRTNIKDVPAFGIVRAKTTLNFQFKEIGNALRSTRFQFGSIDTSEDSELRKLQLSQENEFAERLGQARARILFWRDNEIFWATQNPILLQLDGVIERLLQASETALLDQSRLVNVFKDISRLEAQSETDFLSLEFVRQKISLILFTHLAINREIGDSCFDEQLLMEAGIDPRIILSMIPFLRKDIFREPSGIMVYAGLASMIRQRFDNISISLESDPVLARPQDFDVLGLMKRYLTAWRQRKGFGSIVDEKKVFASVDAALIHVLLYQDQQTSLTPGRSSAFGAELNSIVSNPVDCFERAIELLEEYHRLYALSRLYQSRRMSRKVLETWRRILDGEPDDGGEFADGENELRKYLVNRSDKALVEEYGSWLARKNPKLGVQVFTDESSKVKFTPAEVEALLRKEAPDSVKIYLEHLVFGKKRIQYADELISYYLDSVLSILSTSPAALSVLDESYRTYRALTAPKPTYRQFITDNSIPEPWWHDRLRLLELLGGSYGTGFSYDVPRVLERIIPFEEALVPESIILEGRQGQHLPALRLLIHGLGDYHTAINYCLLGGSSIFHPSEATNQASNLMTPSHEEQKQLFQHLFIEFLAIESPSDRQERTSELLDRFGVYFDLMDVLQRIPDDWSVEDILPYLASAIRRAVSERSQSVVVKALAGVENLKISLAFVEKVERLGAHIVPATDTPVSM